MATDSQILASYTDVADNSPLTKAKVPTLAIRFLAAIYSQLVLGGAGPGGGGATTPADIATGIDLATSIGTVVTRLTQIRDNAQASQYDYESVLDATGVLWVQRFDRVNGTVVYLTPAGVAGTPVAPLTIDRADSAPVIEQFEAITTNPGNWAADDILTRISMVGSVVSTTWLKADGTVLSVIPVINTDVRAYARSELLILRALESIANGGNALLTLIKDQTDTVESELGLIKASVDTLEATTTIDKGTGTAAANTTRTVIASDQAPTTAAQRWRVEITDGTQSMPMGDDIARSLSVTPNDGTTDITIKAPSTSPVAADTALVVAQSPNSVAPPQASLTFTPTDNKLSDNAVPGTPKFSRIGVINSSTTVLFLQIHSSSAALTNGVVPATVPLRIPANSQGVLTRGDLFNPETRQGTDWGVTSNVRVAVSSTLDTYTAPAMTNVRVSFEVVS